MGVQARLGISWRGPSMNPEGKEGVARATDACRRPTKRAGAATLQDERSQAPPPLEGP